MITPLSVIVAFPQSKTTLSTAGQTILSSYIAPSVTLIIWQI